MAMDRIIKKKKPIWAHPAAKAGGGVLALLLFYFIFIPGGGRSLNVDNERITISTVTTGEFEDFIPIRGRVTPFRTLYLDAIEGGRVEAKHVEDGTYVEKGQLIVELSNTQLQLDVISREAQVTEQLNNQRNLELALEQNRLAHKRRLIEIDYQLIRLGRNIERTEELAAEGYATQKDLDEAKDEYNYQLNIKEVSIESRDNDELMQKAQLEMLERSSAQLEANLVFARRNLENLSVRAPESGKLTAFNVEIGQSVDRGERMGQIDDPDVFKVVANIDEFYLGRVDIEQTAELNSGGKNYTLKISKVYPQVTNGQFEIDMKFDGEQPDNIRRGQTLQTRLQLGSPTEAVLIPNGAFYQDTGGNWIFVVAEDGDKAIRRQIRTGRRNVRYIEVLEGLEVGEKVVTSPYANYLDMDQLDINQ